MIRGKRKMYYIIIFILTFAIIGLIIGYAALSTTLTETLKNASQAVAIWNVGFKTGKVKGIPSSTTTVCGEAIVDANTVTVGATILLEPNDSCSYSLVIENKGSINAVLSSITALEPSGISCRKGTGASMVCGNIIYQITTDKGGDMLLGMGRKFSAQGKGVPVYLKVSYLAGVGAGETATTQNGAAFSLVYSQA